MSNALTFYLPEALKYAKIKTDRIKKRVCSKSSALGEFGFVYLADGRNLEG